MDILRHPVLLLLLLVLLKELSVVLHQVVKYILSFAAMDLNELVKIQQQRKTLGKRREQMVKAELRRRQKDIINVDQSAIKKGFIEKTKIILKKRFETIVQPARKADVRIQDNVSASTFLAESSNYLRLLERTKSRVSLDPERV